MCAMGVGSKPTIRVRFPLPPPPRFHAVRIAVLERKSKGTMRVFQRRIYLQNQHFTVVMLDRLSRITP